MPTKKLKIELTPFQAVTILSFLREFDYSGEPLLAALAECVQVVEDEIYNEITNEQLSEVFAEIEVNKLLKRCPEK